MSTLIEPLQSESKRNELRRLIECFPTLGKAYRLKELFHDLWSFETQEEASAFLEDVCREGTEQGIESFKPFIKMLKTHGQGIINFAGSRMNNGLLESIHQKIQLAKRRARGYRNPQNFINMIYFLCGKLTFRYPRLTT